ncbi:14 kDa phosphohistidine phosphatase [Chamberlinius hualienensis]
MAADSSNPKFSAITNVIIDAGAMKYVLMKIYEDKSKADDEFKYILRGYTWAQDYAKLIEHVEEEVKKEGLLCECAGGSSLRHSLQDKRILFVQSDVSEKYGEPDSPTVVELIEAQFPEYGVSFMQAPRKR